ncbi:hypothetical protein [Geodermatophilus sp. CPCC 205506]|uniref:hypothetical protein n=1 Tax=Geodermatophilus sp. CPCC 205506 TaxID=2936596 RepID=UPI003EEBFEF4
MSNGRDGHAVESIEEQLQGLLNRKAIRDVMQDYCRGVDSCDFDFDFITAAHRPDAFDDLGNFEGPDAVVTKVARSTVTAHASRELDDRTYNSRGGGRYLDRFEKRDGRRAIAHRRVANDWARMDEVVHIPAIGKHQGKTAPNENPWYSLRNSSF